MKLYNYWRSSASWRVRIALHHKQLPFTYVPVHIVHQEQSAADYAGKNPMHQVPTLELEDDGHTVYLGQSIAIIEYLDERHPERPLLPQGRVARAHARQLAECVNAGIQPFQNLPLLKIFKQELGADEQGYAARFNAHGLTALEALAAPIAGTFLVGDALSVADLCLIPQLYSARRFGVDLAPFPTLTRVEVACVQLPAFAAAHPDRQPDAPKEAP
jgi:maleylpyruvate isomerase